MSYIDEKDKEIQDQMRKEGKIKISNFNEMVKKYFKSKYNKEGDFEFLYVEYEFYDKDYKTYNLDINDYVSRPQNRRIKTLLPFFLEPNSISDVRTYSLQIPGIIDINNLIFEISSLLPKGVTYITDSQIKEILLSEGYDEPFFDHYFYSTMDYPDFNLYARPLIKIDTENFPQNIPDEETCNTLDDLFSKKQLSSRQVQYCIVSTDGQPIQMTDYFQEYSFSDRKFIRYQATRNQSDAIKLSNNDSIDKDEFYWIEVKPIDFSKNEVLYSGLDTLKHK